jgi:3-oxoacyl-(acyl-carrier-protein) synthase
MTRTVPARPAPAPPLTARAADAGLRVLAAAAWPESAADRVPPPLPGFVVSTFSPLVAEVAARCLTRRGPTSTHQEGGRVAVVVVSGLGDVAGAVHVAGAVDAGRRPGPLMFFQAVPNAVAGQVAARWGLRGPVVCVGDGGAGVEVAALLIEDGDADEALVIRVDQAAGAGERDRAEAVLLSGGDRP